MDARGRFLFLFMPLHDLTPNKEVRGRQTEASLRVLSTAIKQQKGSPRFITTLQKRGEFPTRFSALFIFPSLKKKKTNNKLYLTTTKN